MAFLQLTKALEVWFPLTAEDDGPAVLIRDLLPGDLEDIQSDCLKVNTQIKNADNNLKREILVTPAFNDRLAKRMRQERAIKGFRMLLDEEGKEMTPSAKNIEKLSRGMHGFDAWFEDKLIELSNVRVAQIAEKEKNLQTSQDGSAESDGQLAKPAIEPIEDGAGTPMPSERKRKTAPPAAPADPS